MTTWIDDAPDEDTFDPQRANPGAAMLFWVLVAIATELVAGLLALALLTDVL